MSGVSYYASLGGFPQQSSEGDDRRHAGTVEEKEGGKTLQAQSVRVVRQVVGRLALDVHEEPSKEPGHDTHTHTTLVNQHQIPYEVKRSQICVPFHFSVSMEKCMLHSVFKCFSFFEHVPTGHTLGGGMERGNILMLEEARGDLARGGCRGNGGHD